jgi:Na+/H+ antiporter NhaD/arsenite permease-like protein
MHNRSQKLRIAFLFVLLAFLLTGSILTTAGYAQNSREGYFISGQLLDPQGQPIIEAHVTAIIPDESEPLDEAESQEEGTWVLVIPELPQDEIHITIERPHFQDATITLQEAELIELYENGVYRVGTLVLDRKIDASFWIATVVFLAVLLVIALELLHSTTAALAGFSAIFLVTYIGGAFDPDLFIMSFETGLDYINWDVIFLVMGMMIIIAVIENTGIFQWLAFQAYRLSGGRSWLLVLILMAITAVASALLDNFTTMLLMTPISLQIALALGINPLAFIIPEILASNVGGISTLVGTPTNIIIGAYANISFTDFLVNQTGGVILALIAMGAYVLFHYRKEYRTSSGGISERLYEKLEQNAQIDDPAGLWKSGLVFLLVMVGFIVGEQIHLALAVTAISGAVILLIWLKPDVHGMIKAVDWTTLVFFMALFVVVGAIQEVGLLSIAADIMARLIGDNLALGIFVIVFGVGTVSTVIANIPLAASMLPIVEFLSGTIPGASNKVLFYALSMGAAMGGNGTLIGGEANLVTAGITEQADNPISFKSFVKVGLPVTYITLAVGFIWLLIRF